ncbi:MAG: S-layer protein [Nitrososphaerota archaeon]|nr:S-layer protein [Nitrososphaerota archaeon]MDG6939526.1 S-layer protein [Nitrososphaerota archaeon]
MNTVTTARIVFADGGKTYGSDVSLLATHEALRASAGEVPLGILGLAASSPVYAREVAKKLGVREQAVYYHMRRLTSLGLLRVESTRQVRGAVAKRVVSASAGVALLFDRRAAERVEPVGPAPELALFLREFVKGGVFDGYVVVGSPEPHGSFRASARDGHYAIQLALGLGALARPGDDFAVKLDTDVKAESAQGDNLILVGGPATNLLTSDVNSGLPVRFEETNYWAGLIDGEGRRYGGATDALVAKMDNPANPGKKVVVLAGTRYVGTKAAIIALTRHPSEVLGGYEGRDPYACVLRGFDQDGDGKVDSVDVVARFGGR